MIVETIKMSSKGQIVIPQEIRRNIQADEGTLFAIVNGKDSVILKKIATPSKAELIGELKAIAKAGKRRLESKGLTEKNIPELVHKIRAN